LFRYITWGESHGPAIGCVVDGVPPRLDLTEEYIQQFLDKRKPGQTRNVSQRQETDMVKILSGVFEGKTTGAPISLMIENVDARSKDYGDIKDKYRPGHADFTYDAKYGIRDYRGGGRSSARETASRVAAGAVARLVLKDISIEGRVTQIGPEKDPEKWEAFLDKTRKAGSSAGAIVEVVAKGVPVGLGAPVIDKLDADIAKAMMSINAVKGVEIGAGFGSALLGGAENADEIRMKDGKPYFLSNHAGGILGGISTGQDIVVRMAFKPTSSILTPVKTIDIHGNETEIVTKGRHDPCVGMRGVPVAEAMLAIVLADHLLRHKAQCG
jgi:chorismate synthase